MARDHRTGQASKTGTSSTVSRFGRLVKKPKDYDSGVLRGREPRYGKWNLKDKKKLLECLRKNECVYSNADFVQRSMKAKHRQYVDEYLKRLRRRAAYHCDKLRRKQPPILTWFQVADELTWLKADEELYEAIHTMLSIFCVEANNMQDRTKAFSFANLYKYIRALQKEETLPELSPAESVVILDCFRHLADTLRTRDCEAQAEFMRAQYQKYFKLLYQTPAPKKSHGKLGSTPKEKTDKRMNSSKKTTVSQKPSQNTNQRPLMKAQLIKKSDKRKQKNKKEVVKKGESLEEGKGQSSSQQVAEGGEPSSSQLVAEGPNEVAETVAEEESCSIESTVDEDVTVREKRILAEKRLPSKSAESQIKTIGGRTLNEYDVAEDLDPNSPDFLARFANSFSLGSLNPFEIPSELLYMRKKGQESEEVRTEVSSSVPVEGTERPSESRSAVIEVEEESVQDDEEVLEVDLTKEGTSSEPK